MRVLWRELQVEVARLTLELKEAEMQRDDAESKKASEQQTVNSLQVATRAPATQRWYCQALLCRWSSSFRLFTFPTSQRVLTSERVSTDQRAPTLQVQLDKEDEALSRARLALADERMDAGVGAGVVQQPAGSGRGAEAVRVGSSLDARAGRGPRGTDQADRERELREQQAKAEAAARAEEAKLRRAQAAVRAQMAKVASLERTIR